ncbi:MAG TPA: LUD domain-containing protein [Rhizomicrobium sp.]|nr:LUD domain-containing protein [Rhizomicrobium sp.]
MDKFSCCDAANDILFRENKFCVAMIIGPSHTGDIEQKMEFGAHRPKDMVVLVVKK